MALGLAQRGFRGRITGIAAASENSGVSADELERRLLELGFTEGAQVEVIRRAPLGDPIEFRLRGYHLSLRDEQARFVTIKTT